MSKARLKKLLKPVIYIAIGTALGLSYALFIDHDSRVLVSTIFGAVAGLITFGLSKSGPCFSCGNSNSTCGLYNCR